LVLGSYCLGYQFGEKVSRNEERVGREMVIIPLSE